MHCQCVEVPWCYSHQQCGWLQSAFGCCFQPHSCMQVTILGQNTSIFSSCWNIMTLLTFITKFVGSDFILVIFEYIVFTDVVFLCVRCSYDTYNYFFTCCNQKLWITKFTCHLYCKYYSEFFTSVSLWCHWVTYMANMELL